MKKVLAHALVRKPEPIVWDEVAAAKPAEKAEDDGSALTAH